jgi:hypothetical protein
MLPRISPAPNVPLAEHPTRAPQPEAATPIAKPLKSAPPDRSPRAHPLVATALGLMIAPIVHAHPASEPRTTRNREDPSETGRSAEPHETPQTALPLLPETADATVATADLRVSLIDDPHRAKKEPPAETVLALRPPSAQAAQPQCPVENQRTTDLAEPRIVLRRSRHLKNPPQPQRKKAGMLGINRREDFSP